MHATTPGHIQFRILEDTVLKNFQIWTRSRSALLVYIFVDDGIKLLKEKKVLTRIFPNKYEDTGINTL